MEFNCLIETQVISVCERIDLQNVDNCQKVQLQDVTTVVTNEQIIEQEKISIDNTDDEINSYRKYIQTS